MRRTGRSCSTCADEHRAEEIAALLQALAPEREIVTIPPWDCLPYDRIPPSAFVMGRRIAGLIALRMPSATRIVVTTPEALMQRVPDPAAMDGAALTIAPGPFDQAAFETALAARGYWRDDRVDEAGEVAFRGEVIDLFPADSDRPVRLELGQGRVEAVRLYDAGSQRSMGDLNSIDILPATESWRPGQDGPPAPIAAPGPLVSLFDLMPGATLLAEPRARERAAAFRELVDDAWETRRSFSRTTPHDQAEPQRLYLPIEAWPLLAVPEAGGGRSTEPEVPRFAALEEPEEALEAFVHAERERGRRIVLAAPSAAALRRLARAAGAGEVRKVAAWREVQAAEPGAVLSLELPQTPGFRSSDGSAVVVTALDVFGSRARADDPAARASAAFALDEAFRPGDTVVHRDHGLCILEGLESVEAGEAGHTETIRLRFADDEILLLPVSQAGALWRYGSGAADVSLDALSGQAWTKRRDEMEAELEDIARRLTARAQERAAAKAVKLVPPRPDYERFAARFPYLETQDQARAIADVLHDLASGRKTDRLVCGDVGFGKTEVALRAAAAAVFAGRQVAIAAPTTVLVRQHLETFRRRFQGFGIEIRELSRFVAPAEAKAVKAGLADGSVRIVIGTHALAGAGVAFRELGLVVIDEEQRFGEKHKAAIRSLAAAGHVLTLTATPIPRTLQASLSGLIDLSVIATPPVARRPVRTALLPLDEPAVREALFRENRRGGQSFVVCPRVEDIEPWRRRLAGLVPELSLLVAHGRMKAREIDDAMIRFADGDGDVLLATNIVESGLDVPNANTMLVWRPDRFGLAQLHQLRGRVGRSRVRGVCLLLSDPAHKLTAATRRRLETLAALDRPGAGFAISAQDMDQRGAGDLLGEDQSGHVRLVGADLAHHLLDRALRQARGEPTPPDWIPEVNLGCEAAIPAAYIPEPEVRLNLYHRIARAASAGEVVALAEEIADRFGSRPPELDRLLVIARLTVACRSLGVERLDGGPQALALTFRDGAGRPKSVPALEPPPDWREDRLVWPKPGETDTGRLRSAAEFLRALARSSG